MSVKLQKEQLKLCTALCSPFCRSSVEGDVIVPDIKPDIQKVLQVENSVAITRKTAQTDKVYIEGMVRLNILYIPDGECGDLVKSISACQEFAHTVDIKGAEAGMDVCVSAEADPSEYTLVNSRKLNIRTKVGLSVRLLCPKEVEVATRTEDHSNIEFKEKLVKVYNPKIDVQREFIFRERLEIPSSKPAVAEVLKFSAKPTGTELTFLENKAIIKGEVKFLIMYSGECESPVPEVMEYTSAFCETLEIAGICEVIEGDVEYSLREYSFEVCPDSDGDKKIIATELVICAGIQGFETVEVSTIEDAYGTEKAIETKKEPCTIERMIGAAETQATINETVEVPQYLPEVQKLCDHRTTPVIESVVVEQGAATVKGYITVNFLYLAQDPSMPVSGFCHVIPYEHCFSLEGIEPDAVCDARAEVEHINCTINGGKSLQVRAIISIGIKAVMPCSLDLVTELDLKDDEPIIKMPAMTAYFVQKGDTLWNIAKKFRVSKNAITSLNGEESEIIKPGKCIYIFR